MLKEKSQIINLIISIVLILSTGIMTGYTIGFYNGKINTFPDIKKVADINKGIPTLKLYELNNGNIKGESTSKMRIAFSQDKVIELEKEQEFSIPIYEIDLGSYYAYNNIPKDARYIASKSGKYYYSIFNNSAYNIVENNRLYFSSENEAKNSGFIKK